MDADEREIELKKLSTEEGKTKWTAAAVIVSVLSAAGTIGYGARNVQRAAEEQLLTKVVDVTFNTDSPDVTVNKAVAIASVFGSHLPADLRAKLQDRDKLFNQLTQQIGSGPSAESEKELLRLVLAASTTEETRITNTWKAMHPQDAKWVDEFVARNATTPGAPRTEAPSAHRRRRAE